MGKLEVTVENTSDETMKIRSSVLDPFGPFSLRNALRPLLPNCTHTFLFNFTPQTETKARCSLTMIAMHRICVTMTCIAYNAL